MCSFINIQWIGQAMEIKTGKRDWIIYKVNNKEYTVFIVRQIMKHRDWHFCRIIPLNAMLLLLLISQFQKFKIPAISCTKLLYPYGLNWVIFGNIHYKDVILEVI
jgi:hypothetical protein